LFFTWDPSGIHWNHVDFAPSGFWRSPPTAQERFLFTSFRGNGEDNLHLALSTNSYHWQALNHNRSFLKPVVGAYKIMRDPCLAEGPDGTFHLVWTSGWTAEKGKIIGYAHSTDLIAWSEQKTIPLMENELNTHTIWAPEILCDKAKARWLVFRFSTIPGKFPKSDSTGDDGYNHRFDYATTADFKTSTESHLLYHSGFAIDATLFQAGSKFYLFSKDGRNLAYLLAWVTPCALGGLILKQIKRPSSGVLMRFSFQGGYSIEVVRVDAGAFEMGSAPVDLKADSDEFRQMHVIISKSFYLSRFELSQSDWQAITGLSFAEFCSSHGVATLLSCSYSVGFEQAVRAA
jgi:hypothetical protein